MRQDIIDFIKQFHKKYKYMPTMEEVASELSLSKSTVYHHFHKLLDEGILETDHQCSGRAYRFKEEQWTEYILQHLSV